MVNVYETELTVSIFLVQLLLLDDSNVKRQSRTDLLSVSVTPCRKFNSFEPNTQTPTNFLALTTNYSDAFFVRKKKTKNKNFIC